jgi:hypothetical protein
LKIKQVGTQQGDDEMPEKPPGRAQGAVLAAIAFTALVSCGLGATGAWAQTASQSPALQTTLGEVAPGMWIFLDPETGLVTDQPSREQIDALRAQIGSLVNESTEGLVPRYYPDGTIGLDLQGRFTSVSILTLTPSGESELTCAESAADAVAVLTGKKPIPMLNGLETE